MKMPLPQTQRMRLVVAVLALAIGATLPLLPLVQRWDLQTLDRVLRVVARRHLPVPSRLVLVSLDEASLEQIDAPLALLHRELGELLEALVRAGAVAVAVDLVLPERSYDTIAPGHDAQLVRGIVAVRQRSLLVLARTIDEQGALRPIHLPFLAAAGPGATGLALFAPDADGVVRRFTERLGADGTPVETFVGQLARRLGTPPSEGLVDFGRLSAPRTIPLHVALQWSRSGNDNQLAGLVDGKVVFVGATLPFIDRHRTPLTVGRDTSPGVLVHMQMLQALQQGHTILEFAAWQQALLCAALALALYAASARLRWTVLGVAALAATALVLQLRLLSMGWTLPVAGLLLASAAGAVTRLALDHGMEVAARRRLRQVFAGYVSPPVMKELEAGHLDGMASTRQFICVMFLDIRGFTTHSEVTAPEAVIAELNAMFELATAAIHRHGGTVKEFMGDGVMALFGAPQTLSNPSQAAFDAAREIVAALPALNTKLQQTGDPSPLDIGVGIACGPAIVGHVGAALRHAYGAVGDCVNVASRLEGMTAHFGCAILVTQEVHDMLAVEEPLIPLGVIPLKGHSAVRAFGWRATRP